MLISKRILFIAACMLLLSNAAFSQESPKVIYITGPVGAGKTTFASLLKENIPDTDVAFEPAEKWLDVQGHGSLWDLFLNNAKRWALTAEIYIPLARIMALEQQLQSSLNPFAIIDRSIYEDRYVFAKIAYKHGALSDLEWSIYQEWFAWLIQHSPKPNGFIYLRAAPEVTIARMQERGRTEEKDFPLALQQKFYQCYEDLFINKNTMPKEIAEIPVLVIDANEDFKSDETVQKKCIDQVRTFMENISHPFDYDLNITHMPAKEPNGQVMVCLHGYGSSWRTIHKLRRNPMINDDLVGFNFPDAEIVDGHYDPHATTFGTIQELLPAIYVINQTIIQKNLDAINVYGFSAGGGALVNLIAVLNSTRYDAELASIGILDVEKQRILKALARGHIILDCPLKSVEEVLELRGSTYPIHSNFNLIAQRYQINDLRPIDSLLGWQGLALNVILYFATPDEIIFNRDDQLFIDRLKQVNDAGTTTVIQMDEGGHNTQHPALWQAVSKIESSPFAIGLSEIQCIDGTRIFEEKPRTLDIAVWYPVEKSTPTQKVEFGIWKIQDAAKNAPIFSQGKKLPLILFSHGYSGNQWVGTWFAEYMAAHGYIVAAIRHYGNSFRNMIPEICARPWNRAKDISVALDHILVHPDFKNHIDHNRIGVAGFSQGGIASMWIGGVQAELTPEMLLEQITLIDNPDLRALHFKDIPTERLDAVLKDFAPTDFAQANQSYRDNRIKAAFVIAPGIDEKNLMFTKLGLSKASIPMHITIGAAEDASSIDDARFFAEHIPSCTFSIIPGQVTHFTLLNEGTEEGKKIKPMFTVDHESVDRAKVHKSVAAMALKFFERILPRT